MRVLALSSWSDLKGYAASFAATPHETLREPETGLIMLRGRMGGSGAAFNIGETTVTRCAVRSAAGHEGHAYVMSGNHDHARTAAICDALMQDEKRRAEVEALLIKPLEAALAERRNIAARKAAATKVDFFTLVRGEDE